MNRLINNKMYMFCNIAIFDDSSQIEEQNNIKPDQF